MATYAAIPIASGWAGECWESHDKGGGECREGPFPTPGTDCRETKRACKKVAHDIVIRCADNRCRVGPAAPIVWNGFEYTFEQRRDVVFTRAGSFTMDVEFKPRGGGDSRIERVPVTAITPDGARATCTYETSDAVDVELLTAANALAGNATDLTAALVGAGPCTRLPFDPAGNRRNSFRCPSAVKGASLELRQPDFSMTIAVTCP